MEILKWVLIEEEREGIGAEWMHIKYVCEKLKEATNTKEEKIFKMFSEMAKIYS